MKVEVDGHGYVVIIDDGGHHVVLVGAEAEALYEKLEEILERDNETGYLI